ncbi:MAG TPA: hypothetical protein VL283_02775 [Candidatus Baltobacteraceae bacterium]|nr:hypothetical protein [Candidatus Baltobacteraceae bacterium]
MAAPDARPSLFALMARLTAEERQKVGERRRSYKAQGAEERLVDGGKGEWRLEYWIGKRKTGELKLA